MKQRMIFTAKSFRYQDALVTIPLMSSTLPKVLHSQVPLPGGVCVDVNGNFVAVLWQTAIKYTYFFDKNGWVVKTIPIPADSLQMTSCVFTSDKLFLTDTVGKKILQYTRNGTYENVFTTGFQFLRITTRNNLLYVTIWLSNNVRVYDAANGNIVNHFDVTTNHGRGVAFDKDGRLHVSTFGKQ